MSTKRQSMQGTALRRLLLEQRGGVAAIIGLAIIPLFAVIGLAIDTGRGYMLKSKLSYAIDAAGLAGGRAFDTDLREEDIAMFFEANFPTGYMGGAPPGHPVVTFDDDENTHHHRGERDHPDRLHERRRRARDAGLGPYRDPARAARHGAGPGHGQHRLDARQRRHGGDEAGRDRAGRDPLWRLGRGRELLRRPGAFRRDRQHRRRSRRLADRLRRRRFPADHWKGCVEARDFPTTATMRRRTTRLCGRSGGRPPANSTRTRSGATGPGRVENSSRQTTWATSSTRQVRALDRRQGQYNHPSHLGVWATTSGIQAGPESALKLDNDLYQNKGTGPNLGCPPAITPLVSSKTTC